jgi:CheY-like chemotaxis protein
MDIQLPVMDGYEATRRIRTNPDLKSVPIIAVTSYALAGDESKGGACALRAAAPAAPIGIPAVVCYPWCWKLEARAAAAAPLGPSRVGPKNLPAAP